MLTRHILCNRKTKNVISYCFKIQLLFFRVKFINFRVIWWQEESENVESVILFTFLLLDYHFYSRNIFHISRSCVLYDL